MDKIFCNDVKNIRITVAASVISMPDDLLRPYFVRQIKRGGLVRCMHGIHADAA